MSSDRSKVGRLLQLLFVCMSVNKTGLYCFIVVYSSCVLVFSSSWGLGRAAVCDCGTLWTFLLPFFL